MIQIEWGIRQLLKNSSGILCYDAAAADLQSQSPNIRTFLSNRVNCSRSVYPLLHQTTRLVQLGFFSETKIGGAAQSQNKGWIEALRAVLHSCIVHVLGTARFSLAVF